MALTAEFRLHSPELSLVDVAAAVPNITLQIEDGRQPESGPFVFFIRATGSSFDGLETAFEQSSSVDEHVLISEIESIRLYQIIMTSRRSASSGELTFIQSYEEGVTVVSDGWRVKRQFTNRDEFATFREAIREKGVSFELDRLYTSNSTDIELIDLTDKQREALCLAYEEGYFSVPREASMADVAAEIGISVRALAERLHRAEARLIKHFFYSALYNTPHSLRYN